MKNKDKLYIMAGLFLIIAFLTASVLFFGVKSKENTKNIAQIKNSYSKTIKKLDFKLKAEAEKNKEIKNAIHEKESVITSLKVENQNQKNELSSLKKVQPIYGKVAYLTFDDGPSDNTLKILPILKKYDIRATFFVTGRMHPEYMKSIVQNGNQIGLHCFYHGYETIYKNETAYFNDLNKIASIVKAQIGYEPKIIRFPGGSSNLKSKQYNVGIMTRLAAEVQKRGYSYFDWNCDSGDASAANVPAAAILNKVKITSTGKNQIVILMHDTNAKPTTVLALPFIIEYLRAQGYRFETLNYNSPTYHQPLAN